ncbi:MAG: hypothetical protein Fur0044_18300 [Anaerolineae bacterium]
MNRRIVFGVLLALVLMAGAVSIGVYSYNAGVAQGLIESGKLTDLPPGAEGRMYPYYGGPFLFHRPFGFGFLGCFGPLLFLFLIFALFRGLWWGGPWGWRRGWRHDYHSRGVPPMFDEWHRQAHSQGTEQTSPPSTGS